MDKKLGTCTYTCASCGSKFEILSTKTNPITVDVCSGCHPFYVGNTSNTTLRGRVEKLANKFAAAKSTDTKKEAKKETKKKSNQKVGGLEIL